MTTSHDTLRGNFCSSRAPQLNSSVQGHAGSSSGRQNTGEEGIEDIGEDAPFDGSHALSSTELPVEMAFLVQTIALSVLLKPLRHLRAAFACRRQRLFVFDPGIDVALSKQVRLKPLRLSRWFPVSQMWLVGGQNAHHPYLVGCDNHYKLQFGGLLSYIWMVCCCMRQICVKRSNTRVVTCFAVRER